MNNRRKIIALIVLLLPFVVLGLWTAQLVYSFSSGKNYHVIVEGYDPRDLLHGKYLNLRYVWNDARSERPAEKQIGDLPIRAKFYVPERVAYDLETMLREGKNIFSVEMVLYGKMGQIRSLLIDGKPWQESLDAWRQNRQDQSHERH